MPSCLLHNGNYGDALIDGYLLDAVWCPFADQLGPAAAALLFFGGLGVAQYYYFDSPVPLIVMLMLGGTLIVSQLPAGILQFVGIMFVIIIPAGLWYVVRGLRR